MSEFSDHYIKLLQHTSYDLSHHHDGLEFKYDFNHKTLAQLRESYNLNKVAGHSDELTQLFNVMNWLHEQVKHDNVPLPEQCNALHILELAQDKPVTMNCYALATVLLELLLSLGFYARRIRCRAYDAYDLDSHVVTAVFVHSLDKWIFLDPSWNTYVTDDHGTILGLEEFRHHLAKELPVRVNGNPEHTEWASFYLSYMSKNLFWFTSPQISTFDYDASQYNITTCYLLPEYFSPLELHGQSIEDNPNITWNPRGFWKAPVLRGICR